MFAAVPVEPRRKYGTVVGFDRAVIERRHGTVVASRRSYDLFRFVLRAYLSRFQRVAVLLTVAVMIEPALAVVDERVKEATPDRYRCLVSGEQASDVFVRDRRRRREIAHSPSSFQSERIRCVYVSCERTYSTHRWRIRARSPSFRSSNCSIWLCK